MSSRPGRKIARSAAHRHVTKQEADTTRRTRWWLLGGAVALVAAAIVAGLLAGGGLDDDSSDGFAEAIGEGLPDFPDGGEDVAVGVAAPTLRATTLAGDIVATIPTGKPVLVMVFAHWCPHCQAELPVVVEHMANGGLSGVDVYGLSTAVDPARGNYPPADWFAAEGFTAPVLVDDGTTLADAIGVNSFPSWLLLNADGTVAARTSGELTAAQMDAFVAQAS